MLDRHGAIWLGGNAGLWRYADGEYTQISMPFCGYMYEDRAGNIWANAQSAVDREAWTVCRYEGAGYPVNTYSEVRVLDQKGMFFDIMEDTDGNIWVGKLDGTCRISGEEIECFE